MLDQALRPTKDRLLAPVVHGPLGRVAPVAYTMSSLLLAIGAAVAAWQTVPVLAVTLWLVSRLADGLDGAAARERERATDQGGLLDILGDTIGYAVIPLGVAAGVDTRAAWITVAILLASFYVNAVSWTYLAALLEKRSAGAAATGASTSTVMPRGLVEGFETILFYTLALAWVDGAVAVLAVMAGTVAVTVVERTWWARKALA